MTGAAMAAVDRDWVADLVGLEVATADDLWRHVRADGAGAYAHCAAALRFLAERIPLPLLVARAGDAGFEGWLADRLARATDA